MVLSKKVIENASPTITNTIDITDATSSSICHNEYIPLPLPRLPTNLYIQCSNTNALEVLWAVFRYSPYLHGFLGRRALQLSP